MRLIFRGPFDSSMPQEYCLTSCVVAGAEVPHKVTTGARPAKQLASCDRMLADLIRDCWNARPQERPAFTEVIERVESMAGIRATPSEAKRAARARAMERMGGGVRAPTLPARGEAGGDAGEGASRPVSPSRGGAE